MGVYLRKSREKEFINLLIENKNLLVKMETIKENLWELENISDERVRTFIKRLRAKTSKDLIENVSSQGYMITSNWIFICLNHRVN